MIRPQVALSKDFMESYSRLPRKVQKKVREFTEKFQQDPTQPGINFERISVARDPKVRSVRIDQAYRAIVVHPPKGDVFLCVWVDHHDDAYRWVKDRRFEVNPTVGTFQLFEVVDAGATAAPDPSEAVPAQAQIEVPPTPAEPQGLFAGHDDEDLLLVGVPSPLLAAVRALTTDDDLDALAPHLPSDAAEMLYLLAAGYSILDAIEEADRSTKTTPAVDVEDFSAALAKPESQQQFKILESEAELEAILNAPLEQWRVFLHPSQRRLVQIDAGGPVRVLGGAGTGKTVVLMHRAHHLATQTFTGESDRILVTTFTRNLALDLRMNLQTLCEEDGTFERLEVTNLHSWADQFMRRQGHRFRIIRNPAQRRELFEAAATEAPTDAFPVEFYMDEWDAVVQPQDVDSRDAYLTARRVGRGTRLGRKQRAGVWEVLARYRELLEQEGLSDWQDLVRETRLYIEKQQVRLPYRAVLSDEVQDFTANELKLLRALVPAGRNDLFLVGDAHQRIYGWQSSLGSCGIEIKGRSRRLKLNYRTTEQIRNHAIAILKDCTVDDLDGGVDSLKGFRSLRQGPDPEVHHFDRETDEREFVERRIKDWLKSGTPARSICVAARTNAQLHDRYEGILASAGIESVRVETDPESEAQSPGVRLATMHRMKGLEFSKVLLVGVQEGSMPLMTGAADDAASVEDRATQERSLLYVACTRARDELVIVGYGQPCPLLAAP